jgi:PIN domain nuclease of toxin-antitoxin system
VIYLDTHVAVWLYNGSSELLTPAAAQAIDANPLCVSPAVLLELQYLHEIGRISVEGSTVLQSLEASIELELCQRSFADVVAVALTQTWTRDPFDRLIVAQAALGNAPLLTKDQTIHAHYPRAFWEHGV